MFWTPNCVLRFTFFFFYFSKDPYNPLVLRNIWDWGEMFPDKDISLFYNPLYIKAFPLTPSEPLCIQPCISDLQLWSQCYFRFLPLLEITDGGKPQVSALNKNFRVIWRKKNYYRTYRRWCLFKIDLTARALLSEEDTSGDVLSGAYHVGSFFPFTHWRTQTKVPPSSLFVNSSFNFNNSDAQLDTQSLMTVTHL